MAQEDPNLAPIVAYLEQHRAQVSVEALRKQLLAAGHPEPLVDEAIRRLRAAEPPRPPAAWPLGLGFMVLNVALVSLILVVGGNMAANSFSSPLPVFVVALLPLVAELVAGLMLRGGPRDRLGRGLLWGLGFTASLVALGALLFGICVAIVVALYSANL